MLKIKEASLDWALKHIEKHGDTDIFPMPFEYKAIRYDWEQGLKADLLNIDILEWDVRPHRRTLTPKHKYGFRVATQLDPLDCILFTSLIYEIGEDIENYRLPKENNIVFSCRFAPNDDGDMYDKEYNWDAFQKRAEELLQQTEQEGFPEETYVVVADIADFFPRIYSHPLENVLYECTSKNNHVKTISNMLKDWNYSVSYGIPVGPSATRLLAEIVLDDVDKALMGEGIKFCRFIDDYRFFCSSKKKAYTNLSFLANTLFENHGLTLQQHKTEILKSEDFRITQLTSEKQKTDDNLSKKLERILDDLGINSYNAIVHGEIPTDTEEEINKLNMLEILKEQLESDINDNRLISFTLMRMGRLNNPEAIDICLDNIDSFYPIFKVIFKYLNNLDCLDDEKKLEIGNRLISSLNLSIVGHLDYHRAWVFDLLGNDSSWNDNDNLINLLNKYSDEFSKRKLILALGKASSYFWFKSNKRNFDSLPSWERRAFLAAASCLPGDETKHWYQSINRRLDLLEKSITKWAIKEF